MNPASIGPENRDMLNVTELSATAGPRSARGIMLGTMAMRDGWAPPTLNLREPDNDCDLDYIANVGRALKMESAASLNYGFGGHIGVLLFEK